LTTQIFIYYIGKEEESTTDSAEECHPPPVVSGGGGGGYDLLEKKIMDEKFQRLREALGSDEVISPPSPPSRHEKWKLARTKRGGQMTSPEAYEIAQRIVS